MTDPAILLGLAQEIKVADRLGKGELARSRARPAAIQLAEQFANSPVGFQFNALLYELPAKEIKRRIESEDYEFDFIPTR